MTREEYLRRSDAASCWVIAVGIVLFALCVTYSCGFQEGSRVADEAHARQVQNALELEAP